MVRDLGSRNGILVNGAKLPESKLQSGDVVQIGHLQVKFVDEVGPFIDLPAADDAAPTMVPDSAATKLLDAPTMAPIAPTKKLSL